MNAPKLNTEARTKQRMVGIKEGDDSVFEQLFFNYYHDLCAVALKITRSNEAARDVVQDVFFKLWQTRTSWEIEVSLKAYLYKAVWNEALTYKKKQNVILKIKNEFKNLNSSGLNNGADYNDNTRRIVKQIWQVVEGMPRQRGTIFSLHRRHGLTYNEISEVLEISPKTVENHMGLALKEIRENVEYKVR